jgi:hypothetical protein
MTLAPAGVLRPGDRVRFDGVVPGKATQAAAVRRNASWAINGPSRTLLQPGPPHARDYLPVPAGKHKLTDARPVTSGGDMTTALAA